MNNHPVAFLDSGIGGLPYLRWFKKERPAENIVYCADREHFPYGKRPAGEVRDIVLGLTERIIRRLTPKLVVLACNTASVSALHALRESFDIPFVGVVPAVKPAASLSKKKTIGIMATDRTVEEAYTDELIRRFAGDCRIIRYADGDIIEFVENRFLDSQPEELEVFIRRAVEGLKETDTVVLACTHFIYLKDALAAGFGPLVEVVDSVEGVGRQTIRVIEQHRMACTKGGRAEFYITGDSEGDTQYRRYAELSGLVFAGKLGQ